ncbi:hypothetical protein Q7P36_000771 [Cladosporium allicinum]
MSLSKSVVFALFAALVAAGSAPDGHEYVAPSGSAVRSPSNHGFINRDGKKLTIPALIKGFKDGLNVGADFTTAIGLMGLQSAPNPLSSTFDLDNLDQHNFPIEHDGSLSRRDAYFGDDHTFNQDTFNQVLAYYEGMEETSIPVASKARYNRIETARSEDPEFIYGVRQLVLSTGETALYLSTMGDPTTGVAPVKYVKSLFEKERLPYELGWTPPTGETNLPSLGAMIAKLELANPSVLAEGLSLGEGSLRDVLQLINPLTGKVANLTCALEGNCG